MEFVVNVGNRQSIWLVKNVNCIFFLFNLYEWSCCGGTQQNTKMHQQLESLQLKSPKTKYGYKHSFRLTISGLVGLSFCT